MLSANITPDVAELRKHNVDAIVEKPFDMDELVRVNRLISSPSMVG